MGKQNIDFRNFITPGDILAVIIISAGLIVALFFEEIAIRMIGVSISILGAVALFMLISQRLNDVVESRFPKTGTPAPEFKVTTTKDSKGLRQQVEDFSAEFGDVNDFPVTSNPINKPSKSDIIDDNIDKPKAARTDNKPKDVTYSDGSGMRIVGKVKKTHQDVQAVATNINANTSNLKDSEHTAIPAYNSSYRSSEGLTTQPITVSKTIQVDFNQENENSLSNIQPKVEIDRSIGEIPKSESIPIIETENKSIVENKYSGSVIDLPINVFIETDLLLGDEPRKEFEYFMTRVLTIIRSSTDTRTALFMLFNSQTQEVILESFVTSVPLALKKKLSFKIDKDIVSQIISNSKPQILTEINPVAELDLIPYYNTSTSTGSLVGVPVFWGDGIVGVLVADSESKNAYNSGTVAFLGHFTKLVGALVRSYTHKFELLKSSKTLEAITTFYKIANQSRDGSENVSDIITESLKSIIPNADNGTCGFDGAEDSWRILSYRGSGKECTGKEVDIENTLVGKCIYECKTIHIRKSDKNKLIRVHQDELELEGEFLCVPIKSKTQIYGAIFLESNEKDVFSEFDISIIELIGDHAGNSIEKLYLADSLNSSVLIDSITGLLNPTALYKRLQEELSRAKDYQLKLSVCFFRFDKYASLDPINYPNRFEYTTQIILERIKRYIKEYDLYGVVDESTYGIVFIGRDADQARMNAERIRADIANTIIEHSGSTFSVTVSMGLVSPSKDFAIDQLVSDSLAAVESASKSGNQVQVLY